MTTENKSKTIKLTNGQSHGVGQGITDVNRLWEVGNIMLFWNLWHFIPMNINLRCRGPFL